MRFSYVSKAIYSNWTHIKMHKENKTSPQNDKMKSKAPQTQWIQIKACGKLRMAKCANYDTDRNQQIIAVGPQSINTWGATSNQRFLWFYYGCDILLNVYHIISIWFECIDGLHMPFPSLWTQRKNVIAACSFFLFLFFFVFHIGIVFFGLVVLCRCRNGIEHIRQNQFSLQMTEIWMKWGRNNSTWNGKKNCIQPKSASPHFE